MSYRAPLFHQLSPADQFAVLLELPPPERLARMRMLPLDDAADLIQAAPDAQRDELLGLLEDTARYEVKALLAYAQDVAGGLMNPRFVRLRPEFSVDEAIRYLRLYGRDVAQPIGDAYVLDVEQHLLGIVSPLDLFSSMVRSRGGWLALLFLGEMLTATAMGWYEDRLSRAIVLVLFLPLIIISSGGNAGSQATTLVIRAMALGEVKLRDWWKVVRREFVVGLALGVLLAMIGSLRIIVWQGLFDSYGEHYLLIVLTVALSLLGVVLWGVMAGSLLPFILRLGGLDPASASAPFVATIVDVTGLVIYFSIAGVVLRGTLL